MHSIGSKVRDAIIVHTDRDAPIEVNLIDYESYRTEEITDDHYESAVLDNIRRGMP
jgi:hypothetical protein